MFLFMSQAPRDSELYYAQCAGKQGFESWAAAWQILKGKFRTKRRLDIYRCPHCHLFHMGNKRRRMK